MKRFELKCDLHNIKQFFVIAATKLGLITRELVDCIFASYDSVQDCLYIDR